MEKYRQRYESDEHWALRRSFIERHYGSMPENKLLCLAQVFANVEILGCRYPEDVMLRVQRLAGSSKDCAPFERMTFVKERESSEPSTPPNDKAIRRKRNGESTCEPAVKRTPHSEQPSKLSSLGELIKRGTLPGANIVEKFYLAAQKVRVTVMCDIKELCGRFTCKLSLDGVDVAEGSGSRKKVAKTNAIQAAWEQLQDRTKITTHEITDQQDGTRREECLDNIRLHFPNFVIVENSKETSALNVLSMSSSLNKAKCMVKSEEGDGCRVGFLYINGVVIGRGSGENSKVAKTEAAKNALCLLRKLRPTIRIKQLDSCSGEELTKEMVSESSHQEEEKNVKIADDNVGFKLLKLMGWSGGGMGKEESGIIDPIVPKETIRRAGLGFQANKRRVVEETNGGVSVTFKKKVTNVVREFAKTVALKDLVFSPEFDSEERKYIHSVANRFGLKSVSRNGPEGRFLTLRHKFTAQALLEKLLELGSTEKYQVILPQVGA
ncbi:NF-kappa-B-repressing factor-like [Ornithodoros turicata]|uniref:NF-kappa-B-repressing factor-like n=1 Tax=Ornithodoros turicata TaxID=34597 RepID=UPI003139892D